LAERVGGYLNSDLLPTMSTPTRRRRGRQGSDVREASVQPRGMLPAQSRLRRTIAEKNQALAGIDKEGGGGKGRETSEKRSCRIFRGRSICRLQRPLEAPGTNEGCTIACSVSCRQFRAHSQRFKFPARDEWASPVSATNAQCRAATRRRGKRECANA
jgi:hypothetical protein